MISQSSCANILEIQERSSFGFRLLMIPVTDMRAPIPLWRIPGKSFGDWKLPQGSLLTRFKGHKPQPGAFLPINEPFFYVQMQTPDAELPAGGWPDHLTYPAAFIAEVRRIEANAKTAAVNLAKKGAPINEAKQVLGTALCGHWHMATENRRGIVTDLTRSLCSSHVSQ